MNDVKDLKREEKEKQIKDETLDKVSGGGSFAPAPPPQRGHQHPPQRLPSPNPVPRPEPL